MVASENFKTLMGSTKIFVSSRGGYGIDQELYRKFMECFTEIGSLNFNNVDQAFKSISVAYLEFLSQKDSWVYEKTLELAYKNSRDVVLSMRRFENV